MNKILITLTKYLSFSVKPFNTQLFVQNIKSQNLLTDNTIKDWA